MIFFKFSMVSERSIVRSNCPPVVGVMLIVISSGSTVAVAVAAAAALPETTRPHPGGLGDVGIGEEELDLIFVPRPRYSSSPCKAVSGEFDQ